MASQDLQSDSYQSDSSFDSQNLESDATPLHKVVAEIASLSRTSDDYTLILAEKVVQLKARLIRGEAGKGVKWSLWIATEAKLSRQYIYFLAKIGSAPDPQQALKDARDGWRVQKKPKDGLSRNHQLMIRLVAKLSDDEAKAEYLRLWQRYRQRAG